MAQATYEQLLARMADATDTLEEDVLVLNDFVGQVNQGVNGDLAKAVADAQAAETSAREYASDASKSATAATVNGAAQVTLAKAQADKAEASATKSADSATKAASEASKAADAASQAKATADALKASAPFSEAPSNGQVYGRKDGEWTVVTAGEGGGGTGTVTAVNGVGPDNDGNVTITVPTAVSELTNDAGYVTSANIPSKTSELQNDSGFVTSDAIPTQVSQLENNMGYVRAGQVPTNTDQLENGAGFITADDIPRIPTRVSELTNDSGYALASSVPTTTNQLTNNSGFITSTDLPTKVSQLTNDKGYITSSDLPTPAIASDSPKDGKQYARQNGAWTEVVAPDNSGGNTGGLQSWEKVANTLPGWGGQTAKVYLNPRALGLDKYTQYAMNGVNTSDTNVQNALAAIRDAGWNLWDGGTPPNGIPALAVNVKYAGEQLTAATVVDGGSGNLSLPIPNLDHWLDTGGVGLRNHLPNGTYYFPATNDNSKYFSKVAWENMGLPASLRSGSYALSVSRLPSTISDGGLESNSIVDLHFTRSSSGVGTYRWSYYTNEWKRLYWAT